MNSTPRNPLLSGTVLFTLVNVPVSIVIALPLFQRALTDTGAGLVPNLFMFLSSMICLNLLYGTPLLVLSLLRPPRQLLAGGVAFIAGLIQLLLLLDVKVFAFFKFHINGLVLNFLTTEGAGDSLKLGTATLLTYALIAVLILGFELLAARLTVARLDSFATLRRWWLRILLLLIAVVVFDKALYIHADLTNRIPVLASARYYPLYRKVTAKHAAAKWFGIKIDREKDISFAGLGKSLNYPLQPLTFTTNAPRYNVVFLVADGFRSDMLTPAVTPHLVEFARQNLTLQDHFSGGNGTRFGIFSLFYGAYATLWHPFLAARQSPVLIDELQRLRYQFCILASTRLTFPEFRKTAFVKIPDAIQDEHTVSESWKRDATMVQQFHQFLENRDPARPFFAFAFFNSSHPFYQYPKEFEKFTPVISSGFNYMKNLTPAVADQLKNCYRNSLYYTDSLFQQVIDDLRAYNALDNTILVITGDHGEEFLENGFYSHNSAFDDYQTKTTMVLKFPGHAAQTITNLTSHLDIVPTVLTALGCTTPPAAYSHGRDLFTGEPRQYTFCTDWDYGAIITDTERVVIPVASEKTGFVELRTATDYRLITDRDRLKPYRPLLLQLAKDLSTFLK